jgi:hypothetical protein
VRKFVPSNQFSLMTEFLPVPIGESLKPFSEIVHDRSFVVLIDL